MKRTSTALLAHLAQRGERQTTARCVRVERQDGTIVRFTDHDSNIVISGYVDPDDDLNGTYLASPGFDSTDLINTSSLAVDNADMITAMLAPAILEVDLHAGLWDYCKATWFLVNYADLTQGPHYLKKGTTGQLRIEKTGEVRTEIRGLTQALSQTIGILTTPTCLNTFGDARCGVSLTSFTFTGTIDGVSDDGLTLYDSARTEDGAADGVAITGITNANPGVVTMANPSLNLQDGQAVTISGVIGPSLLNAVTIARNPSGSTFQLTVDTTDTSAYPAYVSGGTVTPVGGGRSVFDGGRITWTSGLNNGLSQDVKTFAPGQITLIGPMPYPVAPGDTYSITQGCGKSFETNCVAQYSNGDRFRGFPHLRGIDLLVQVGRQQ